MESREKLIEELRGLSEELAELQETNDSWSQADAYKARGLCDKIEKINIKLEDRQPVGAGVEYRSGGFDLPGDKERTGKPSEEQYNQWGEFLQCVVAAGTEPGQRFGKFNSGTIYRNVLHAQTRSSGMEESVPSSGGFAVGKDLQQEIYSKAHPAGSLYDRCRKIAVSGRSNGIKLPFIDATSRADGSRPLRSYWTGEGEALTAKQPKLGLIELDLKKLTNLVYLTSELMDDAPALAEWVIAAFAKEIRFKCDVAIVRGTGAGQPLGILNAAALVTVAKQTGANADTIVWEDIKAMYAQLFAPSRASMVWLTNQNCLEQLMSMTQPVGTGGIPVWLPASGASGTPFDTLLGRPLLLTEACSKIGDLGDIFAFDPKEYLIIEKRPFQFASSIHVRFVNDEHVLRYIARLDGQPIWNGSLIPYQDTTTSQPVSPYVTLAARA